MAKNKTNTGILGGIEDLAANAQKKIQERNTQHTHDTQGTQSTHRKQKYPRINMAFYDDNLEYVREAAYRKRLSVTEYINQLIVDDKNRQLIAKEPKTEQMSLDEI